MNLKLFATVGLFAFLQTCCYGRFSRGYEDFDDERRMLENSLKPHRYVLHNHEDLDNAERMLETEERDSDHVMLHENNRESNDMMSHDSYAESGLDASNNEYSRSDGERRMSSDRFDNGRNDHNDLMYLNYNRIRKMNHDMKRLEKKTDCCDFFDFYDHHKDTLRYNDTDKSEWIFGDGTETVMEAFKLLYQEQDVLYKCIKKAYPDITGGCKVDCGKAGITYHNYSKVQQIKLRKLETDLNKHEIKCKLNFNIEKTAVEMIKHIHQTLHQYVNCVTKAPASHNCTYKYDLNYQKKDAADESSTKRTLQHSTTLKNRLSSRS